MRSTRGSASEPLAMILLEKRKWYTWYTCGTHRGKTLDVYHFALCFAVWEMGGTHGTYQVRGNYACERKRKRVRTETHHHTPDSKQ
jgi:hypothetical protein